MRRSMQVVLAAATVGLFMAGSAQGQVRGQAGVQQQQQMHQQQRIQQLDQQIQRMDQIRQRIHQFDQECLQQRDRIRDQDRIRQLDQLRTMSRAYDGMAEQAQGIMRQLRQMEQDQRYQGDGEMQREMERLRMHSEQMNAGIGEALQSMERIRERVLQPR